MALVEQLYGLNNKIIIITGASSGLGLAVAQMMTKLGARVYGLSKRGKIHYAKSCELTENLFFHKLDVRIEKDIQLKFSEIAANEGCIDVLVNNAGITVRKRAEEFPAEDLQNILNTNVTAVYNCCKHAYPYLKNSKGVGRIINITSMAAFLGFSEVVPYSASKAAVSGITRGLAVEWAGDNILVNSVSPGWFPSEMTEQVMDDDRKNKILNRMPLHRFGKPDELAAMVCFLASSASSYITGQDFSVDGGALIYGY